MALVVSRDGNYPEMSWGAFKVVFGTMAFDADYQTGGLAISSGELGLNYIQQIIIPPIAGYVFDYVEGTQKVKAFDSVAGGTPTGVVNMTNHADSAGTPSGAVTGALDVVVPKVAGVGITAVGQVMTTTDKPVIGLNAAAGMWLKSATTGLCLVISNTAGTGVAPVAFTVVGTAFTDAGAYQVLTMGPATFVGVAMGNHSHANTAAFVGAAVPPGTAAEVPLHTNLAALSTVDFIAIGL